MYLKRDRDSNLATDWMSSHQAVARCTNAAIWSLCSSLQVAMRRRMKMCRRPQLMTTLDLTRKDHEQMPRQWRGKKLQLHFKIALASTCCFTGVVLSWCKSNLVGWYSFSVSFQWELKVVFNLYKVNQWFLCEVATLSICGCWDFLWE